MRLLAADQREHDQRRQHPRQRKARAALAQAALANAVQRPRSTSGHGSSITGSQTRYHQIGCACVPVLTPWMRSNGLAEEDRVRVLRRRRAARPESPTRARSRRRARSLRSARRNSAPLPRGDAAVPPRREHGREADVEQHHRPFRQDAEPDAETGQHDAAPPRSSTRSTMPCSASSAQVVSSTSNMIAFANAAKYSMPSSSTVDVRAAHAEPVTRSVEPREQEEAQRASTAASSRARSTRARRSRASPR